MLKKRTIKSKIVSFIMAAQFSMMALTGCTGVQKTEVRPKTNVRVAEIQLSSIEASVQYAGRLKPLEEVAVTSKLSGRVESVKFDVGQQVKKGDVLFTLEKRDIEAQYNQSQAALKSANANLARTEDSLLSQQIMQAESVFNLTQVQYNDMADLYNKTKSLYESGAAAKRQLDDMEAKFKSAEIQLNEAKKQLDLLREKGGPQSISVAKAQAEQSRAATDLASAQLDYTTVQSPITGIVSVRSIDEGEMSSNAVPAFVIINSAAMTAEIGVPGKIAESIRKGQAVPIRIDVNSGKALQGVVDMISPNADAKTQLYTVKILLENPDGSLKPGTFARATFTAERRENVLTVPNEAIIVENSVQYVYVVTDDKITKKAVAAGLSNEKSTEITGGLSVGELVVIEGQSFLNEGERVNISK